ncbi:MAG: mechanosensitive ion channel family protein [Bdellovibrionales bacterium]
MEELKIWLQNVGQIWTYELFVVDGQPFSLGKLVTGIILLAVGYWLSKRLARTVERRLIARLEIEASMKMTLSRVLFYFFLAVSTLFTLHTLNVPITIFAVLGGALAIGFGFGSQNVVNNFISGIILMIEQPVRVGDIVEVDGVRGIIEIIGIRSTHIRTVENREVVIPNSFFLEKSVINSTLSDDIIRGKISLGVSYGSNIERVKEILENVCIENENVKTEPKPRALFSDFGDSALIFDILFWYSLRGEITLGEIESELRFEINKRFSDAKISIPFPQRDVRVLADQALRVSLAAANENGVREGR